MKWLQALSVFVLVAAISYLGMVPAQSDFFQIILSAILAFSAYLYLSFFDTPSIQVIFTVGILIRIILLFAFPNLSDDIYRFVWDGSLIGLGINPYGSMPSELINSNVEGLSIDLYTAMNSPHYYTIYPPFTQFIFYVSTLFTDDIYRASLVIKVFFLLAEMFTFLGITKILHALQKNTSLAIIYFLNPLILIEGMGNLHFEVIMIVFLVWSCYYIFIKKKMVLASLFFTLSIASKLLPLMFLPFFFFKMKKDTRIRFFGFGLLFMCIAFSPIVIGLDLYNFASSIELYFQKFEFNGGMYYLLRYLGKQLSGYNLIHYIGPLLGLIAVILILRKAYVQKVNSLEHFLEFAFYSFIVYLLLATTIHPWYLSIPILWSVFVHWRFALVWSFMIIFTYINYSYNPYWENLWVVGLEYFVVISFLFYEWKEKGGILPWARPKQ